MAHGNEITNEMSNQTHRFFNLIKYTKIVDFINHRMENLADLISDNLLIFTTIR